MLTRGHPADGWWRDPAGRVPADRRPICVDLDAALRMGAARGCDLDVLSEPLPAAEAGLVEALAIDRGRRDHNMGG